MSYSERAIEISKSVKSIRALLAAKKTAVESTRAQNISDDEKLSQITILSDDINDAIENIKRQCISKGILWSDVEVLLYKSM